MRTNLIEITFQRTISFSVRASEAVPKRGPTASENYGGVVRKQFSQALRINPHISWSQLHFSQVREEAHSADGTELM